MTPLLLLALAQAVRTADSARPDIYFAWSSAEAARVRLVVDGVDVTEQSTLAGRRITYVPAEDLAAGEHRVQAVVTDVRGRALVKNWTFAVEAGTTSFVRPTPANGSVLAARDLPVSVAVRSAGPVDLALSRDGGPYVSLGARTRFADGLVRVDLPELRAGAFTVRAGTDRYTSFSVDTEPPRVESVAVDPPVLREPGAVRLQVRTADAPFGEVRSVELDVKKDGRVIERFADRPVDGLAQFDWSPGALEAGRYTVDVRLTDWAGNVTEGGGAGGLEVAEGYAEAAAREVALRFDRLPSRTGEPRATVSGSATPGTEVELFVNGRSVGRTPVAGASGEFAFRGVALEPGRNRVSAVATETAGGRRSREQSMMTTLEEAMAVRPAARPGVPAQERPPAAGAVRPAVATPAALLKAPTLTHPPKDQKIGAPRIAVGGESEPGVDVLIYVNGRETARATANASGRFNEPQVELSAGANVITARARSAAGLGPPSEGVTVTLEKPR